MMFNFEIGRQTAWTTLMSRQLLQNIRDSGCVDMESLCILAHENVSRRRRGIIREDRVFVSL